MTISSDLERLSLDVESQDQDSPSCRICFGRCKIPLFSEPLITPCKCKGSIGLVHQSCLERWLSVAHSDSCDLCQTKFHLKLDPHGWFRYVTSSDLKERQYLLIDVLSFFILTPVLMFSLQICFEGLLVHSRTKLQVSGLVFLICILVLTYVIWLAVCTYHHVDNYQKWTCTNYDLKLCGPGDQPVDIHLLQRPAHSDAFRPARPGPHVMYLRTFDRMNNVHSLQPPNPNRPESFYYPLPPPVYMIGNRANYPV